MPVMVAVSMLSKDKARKRKVWDEIQSAMEEDGIVKSDAPRAPTLVEPGG